MSKKYNHLSSEQRYQIEALLRAGKSKKEIAFIIQKDPATIYREIKRNGGKYRNASGYNASNAVIKTSLRHRNKPKRVKFTQAMKSLCKKVMIDERYSPELISVEGLKQDKDFVSHETIYKWIWECKHSNRAENLDFKDLHLYLKHCKRKKRRGKNKLGRGSVINNRVSIEHRPKIVSRRKRIGDLEVDLMIGKDQKSAMLVTLDRASLFIRLKKLKSKSYPDVEKAFDSIHRSDRGWIKTITFDNDSAFICNTNLSKKYNAKTYFTRPFTSQDKGSVENRIGVLRRFLPKGTDLRLISSNYIRQIEKKLNNRPVKKFNYKTPQEVFLAKKIALIT